MPSVLVSQYFPVNGRSVPASRRTWYCSSSSFSFHSSAMGLFLLVIIVVIFVFFLFLLFFGRLGHGFSGQEVVAHGGVVDERGHDDGGLYEVVFANAVYDVEV